MEGRKSEPKPLKQKEREREIKLSLGEREGRKAFNDWNDNVLKVLIFHHPISCLRKNEIFNH